MEILSPVLRLRSPAQPGAFRFAWFDVHRDGLLQRTGGLTPEGYVVGTIGRGKIDAEVRAELVDVLAQLGPPKAPRADLDPERYLSRVNNEHSDMTKPLRVVSPKAPAQRCVCI